MGLIDILDSAKDMAGNVASTAGDLFNSASTTVYSKVGDFKESKKEKKNGRSKAREEGAENTNNLNNMLNALKGDGISDEAQKKAAEENKKDRVGVKELLGSDIEKEQIGTVRRGSDDVITEEDNISGFKKSKVATENKKWLTTALGTTADNNIYDSIYKESKNLIEKNKMAKALSIPDQEFRVEISKASTKMLEDKFNEYNAKYNQSPFAKQTIDTALNAYILKNIFGSFVGDSTACAELDKECDVSDDKAKLLSNITKDYLYARCSTDKASQYLFLAVHNVDISKLSGEKLTAEKAINLALLKDQCPNLNVSSYEDLSPRQIDLIVEAAHNNQLNFNNIDFTSKYFLYECIDKTRKSKDMELLDISNGKDQSSLIFEYKSKSNLISVSKIDFDEMNEVVSLDENNNEISGSFNTLLNIFKSNDNLINLSKNSAMNSLDSIVRNNRSLTVQEAAANPLSAEEKNKIEQEYQEAMDQLISQHGMPVGYQG